MENEEPSQGNVEEKRNPLTSVIVGIVGAISAVFLFNPGLGVFLEIPDNIPIVGNLDEAAAAALLISCLAYFGLDLGNLFGKKPKKEQSESTVIDVDVDE